MGAKGSNTTSPVVENEEPSRSTNSKSSALHAVLQPLYFLHNNVTIVYILPAHFVLLEILSRKQWC